MKIKNKITTIPEFLKDIELNSLSNDEPSIEFQLEVWDSIFKDIPIQSITVNDTNNFIIDGNKRIKSFLNGNIGYNIKTDKVELKNETNNQYLMTIHNMSNTVAYLKFTQIVTYEKDRVYKFKG